MARRMTVSMVGEKQLKKSLGILDECGNLMECGHPRKFMEWPKSWMAGSVSFHLSFSSSG